MEKYYNDSLESVFIGDEIDTIKMKRNGGQLITIEGNEIKIGGDNLYAPGVYKVVGFRHGKVIVETEIEILQGITTATQDYDFRSANQIALQAIVAFMQGKATSQQKRVKVGDKQIQYSSFEELLKWKNYFQKEVRKEHGKSTSPKYERLYLRG